MKIKILIFNFLEISFSQTRNKVKLSLKFAILISILPNVLFIFKNTRYFNKFVKIKPMTSNRQTLSEYIKRKQNLRSLKFSQYTSVSLGVDREIADIIESKKSKVNDIMSQILKQVKRTTRDDQNITMLEKLIKAATEDIKNEISKVCQIAHNKVKESHKKKNQKQDQGSQVSISERLQEREAPDGSSSVLMQVKTQNHLKGKNTDNSSRYQQTKDTGSRSHIQLNERTQSKQNNKVKVFKKGSGDDLEQKSLFYTFNNKGFSRKQTFRSS